MIKYQDSPNLAVIFCVFRGQCGTWMKTFLNWAQEGLLDLAGQGGES